jgi:hypothetical protein
VERDHGVAELAGDEHGGPAFSLASLAPRCGSVALGHRLGHGRGVIPVSTSGVLDELVLAPVSFRGCGRAGSFG